MREPYDACSTITLSQNMDIVLFTGRFACGIMGLSLRYRFVILSMTEPSKQSRTRPAGFWLRLYATLIDLTTITSVVVLAADISASFEFYIPQEVTILIFYTLYSAASLACGGRTLGKWICGIKVNRCNGNSVGTAASVIRALVVAISLCLVGLPFLFVAFRRQKRGFHDLLSGTTLRDMSVQEWICHLGRSSPAI